MSTDIGPRPHRAALGGMLAAYKRNADGNYYYDLREWKEAANSRGGTTEPRPKPPRAGHLECVWALRDRQQRSRDSTQQAALRIRQGGYL